jgi:hypothetical protein
VYPYFSNPEKQFEFEKVRIYVEEVEEKEILISGGAQFNFGYLVDSNQPITIPSPIKTDYNYSYKFEIKQNNQLINEQEFLIGIGLEKEAQEILKNQISNYFDATFTAKFIHKKNLDDSNIKIIKKSRNFDEDHQWALLGAGAIHLVGVFYSIDTPVLGLVWHAVALGIHIINIMDYLNYYDIEYKRLDMQDFKYKQSLSNEQIISLSESFNKKVYEQIKTK